MVLVNIDQNWKSMVEKTLAMKDDQLNSTREVIGSLRQQVHKLETLVSSKDKEIDYLRRTLKDANSKIEATREDTSTLLETTQKHFQEEILEAKKKLETKERELEEVRTRTMQSIRELTLGARETLQELEAQLDSTKESMKKSQERVVELEKIKADHERQLKEMSRNNENMCQELHDVKGKLKSTKFATGKLREEINMMKKYCEQKEDDREAIKKCSELETKVLNKLIQVDSFLRTEKHSRNVILDAMNRFGANMMKEMKQINDPKRMINNIIETQIDRFVFNDDKDEMIQRLEQNVHILMEELKKRARDFENLKEQNKTLRDVIKELKRERDEFFGKGDIPVAYF